MLKSSRFKLNLIGKGLINATMILNNSLISIKLKTYIGRNLFRKQHVHTSSNSLEVLKHSNKRLLKKISYQLLRLCIITGIILRR